MPVASRAVTFDDDLAPWERPATAGGFSLSEGARRIGHYAWAEMRIFEILGVWSHTIAESSVAARVGIHANQHAWHAELWHQRFPELREWDRAESIRPASAGLADFFDAVEAAESTLARLVAAYRVVLPHLVATYGYHRNRSSEVGDGPTLRSLSFILGDDTTQLSDGALMLAATVHDDTLDTAIDVQHDLESRLTATGGIAGPGTVPRL